MKLEYSIIAFGHYAFSFLFLSLDNLQKERETESKKKKSNINVGGGDQSWLYKFGLSALFFDFLNSILCFLQNFLCFPTNLFTGFFRISLKVLPILLAVSWWVVVFRRRVNYCSVSELNCMLLRRNIMER